MQANSSINCISALPPHATQVMSVKDATTQAIAALPREPVLSMRYSLDDSILAIRRTKRSLVRVA
jgi:hypothetical protein